ncbi:putative cytochrome P450 CYP13A8 [Aphelenchoides besseyi]|nr:putative cytochrome P450 CYP13A8 [Aphelenchoides besseyi]KAI6223515.1 putative cytochrome P450 CYP13A8 [Aphelenchoides besseyi]
MILIATILIGFVVFVVGLFWKHKDYWKSRGIKGPEPALFVGSILQLGDPNVVPHAFVHQKWTQEFGPIYGIQRGWTNVLIISDVKMAHKLFNEQFDSFHGRDHPPLLGDPDKESISHVFMAQGSRWKRLRALTSPVFSNKNLKKILPTIQTCSETVVDRMSKELNEDNELNIREFWREYAADVIFRIAFDRKESPETLRKWADRMLAATSESHSWYFKFTWIFPCLVRIVQVFRFCLIVFKHVSFLIFIRQLVAELRRRQADKKIADREETESKDFIDFFMKSQSDDVRLDTNSSDTFDRHNVQVVKELSLMEVLGQLLIFLFAGFDTVANALSFMTQFLVLNPEVQERLRTEIESVIGDENPNYEQLNQLKYTEAVIKETLRIYPLAAAVNSRRCMKTTELDGVKIEAGTDVIVDVVSVHRDPKLWGSDAEAFRPERWIDENSSIPQNAFFGFGSGFRQCVGQRLGMIELKMALIYLLRRYRLFKCPKTKFGDDHVVGFVLHPVDVVVRMERISDI